MCGIAGAAWTPNAESLDRATLRRMTDSLRHRGPDDEGAWERPPGEAPGRMHAALGHRRLSIIDVAGGHQPMSNEDGTVWIAFNGEIYNYRELRPDLEARGHIFTTSTDTEVLLHAYEEYGVECLKKFRG